MKANRLQYCYLLLLILAVSSEANQNEQPNIILINVDDQGYNDLSSYGSKVINTPYIDKMAKEGRKFNDFMNASSVCTPSRAALLTGSYPKRVSMEKGVIFPQDTAGLHPDEVTIADLLQKNGYQTTIIGKWHVGHEPELLPTKQGFDYYYGIPFSNDMNHISYDKPKLKQTLENQRMQWAEQNTTMTLWHTPLMENEEIIEMPVDQRSITRRYTDKTLERIQIATNEKKPFFIYLAHSMPHVPIYVPEGLWEHDFNQAYKIVNEHIDAQVGRILEYLRETGIAKNTYVFYTSDNGPSTRQTGSAYPLTGKKFSNNEGGYRVPFIAWAPGRIPANTQYNELVTTMDLLPTIAALSSSELDLSIVIDGHDVSEILLGEKATPTQVFLYYNFRGDIVGIRQSEYKLIKLNQNDFYLYNLKNDVSEKEDISRKHPKIVQQLRQKMLELDQEITQNKRPAWQAKE